MLTQHQEFAHLASKLAPRQMKRLPAHRIKQRFRASIALDEPQQIILGQATGWYKVAHRELRKHAHSETGFQNTPHKIGITVLPLTGSPVLLSVDGVGEAVTFDATYNAFTPTTVPNGSRVYVLTFNL